MPFMIDDPKESCEKCGKATVSASLIDYVNDIYDGGVVANFRTGPLIPRSMCMQSQHWTSNPFVFKGVVGNTEVEERKHMHAQINTV